MTRTHQKNGIAKCLQEIICCVLKEVISYSLVRESISTSNLSRRSHPNRKSNPSLLDNGPLNPRGPAIAIASEFIGKQLEFKNVCLFGCTVAVCVCEREMELMWVDACVCDFFYELFWVISQRGCVLQLDSSRMSLTFWLNSPTAASQSPV